MNQLHDTLTERLLFGDANTIDDANSVDVQMHNVMLLSNTMNFDYDVSRLWTTRARWNALVRQYIDKGELETWLDSIEGPMMQRKRGIAVLRTNTVAARQTGRGVTRRWGSCMLSLSYRHVPWPQITLHSRTCYLGYLSAFDLNVAHNCARLIAQRLHMAVEPIKFVWVLEMAQFHGFRCIAYPLGGSSDLFGQYMSLSPSKAVPGHRLSRMWYDRLATLDNDNILYGDMKFSSYRRVRRRFHTQVMGEDYANEFTGGEYSPKNGGIYRTIPQTMTSDLDFSPIGM